MPSPPEEAPLPELLRAIADQAQEFARAEIGLVKIEAKQGATKAAIVLIVVTGSALLLAIALSLIAAAVVIARHGSPAAALLTAAGVDLLVAGVAIAWMISRLRRRTSNNGAASTRLSDSPHPGSQLS